MEDKNFLEKNKTLLVLFGFCSLLLMFFSVAVCRGLFSDIPTIFMSVLQKQANYTSYFFYHEILPNNFSSRLLALPYNCFSLFFDENPISKINLYTFSCMFMTFAVTILNFMFAKRTKQYGCAALALLFYAMFTVPFSIYPINTTYISIPMFFIFLQYFWTEEKINKLDYLAVIALSGYMFQSSPNMVIPCILLGVTGVILLLKGHTKHWKVKSYISVTSLIAAGYMLYKTFFFTKIEDYTCPTFQDCIWTFDNAFRNIFENFWTSDLIISLIALVFLLYALIRKKELGKISGIVGSLAAVFAIYSIYEFSKFVRDPFVGQRGFAIAIAAFIVVVFGILVINIVGKHINKDRFCNNVIAVACFCGIIQCLLQFVGCLQFGKYSDYISNKVNENVGIVKIDNDDYSKKSFLIFDSCQGTLPRSLMVSQKDLKSIMVPSDRLTDGDEACWGNIDISHINNEDYAFIVVQDGYFPMKNNYWKFNNIVPLLEKLK